MLATLDRDELGTVYIPVWDAVRDYYERDAATQSADTAIVTARVAGTGAGDKRQKALRDLCEEIWAEDVSPANIADFVRDFALESSGQRFAAAVAGRRSRDEIEPLARNYVQLLDVPDTADEQQEVSSWRDALRKRLDPAGRIKVSPACLNEVLGGGVYRQTNFTIVGRPEVGKSALGLTMACGFARRGLHGLWLTNEDAASIMNLRAACNFTNKTEQELYADEATGEREGIAKGAARLRFVDISPGTPKEIERLIKSRHIDFLVIDQIRNLRVLRGEGSSTENLDAAAQLVRNMGKKYDLITIGLTQAGDSATGKLVVNVSDIDSSKTGIPGASDVIVCIGMNEELKAANQRMLHTPKNKVTSRHEFWQVSIDPFRSKYRSLK